MPGILRTDLPVPSACNGLWEIPLPLRGPDTGTDYPDIRRYRDWKRYKVPKARGQGACGLDPVVSGGLPQSGG